jgi:hypothetical protein
VSVDSYQVTVFLKNLFSEKQREIIRYWLKSIPAFFYQNNLSRLAELYGTDKLEHGYTSIYESYFKEIKNKKLRILEIGIGGGENIKFGGNSLKMLAKYFTNSQILGIDIYDKSLIDYRRIKTYRGDQTDADFLSQFSNLDIIIDDGGHINSDIIQSFEFLFSRLNTGGFYCIEDTQVSGLNEYHNANYPSTIDYFKSKTNHDIEFTKFYEKLIVIKKK